MRYLSLLVLVACHRDSDPNSPYDHYDCIDVEGEDSMYCCPVDSKDDTECWLEERQADETTG